MGYHILSILGIVKFWPFLLLFMGKFERIRFTTAGGHPGHSVICPATLPISISPLLLSLSPILSFLSRLKNAEVISRKFAYSYAFLCCLPSSNKQTKNQF